MQVFLDSNLQPVHKTKDSREGITDLKYSPDCRLLAAATADTWIDIYSVSKGYTRLQRCSGHSSTVRGIDWSTDGSVLQSDSADLELLVWNARTGKQIPIPSRDVQFATYTLRLGFPVMGIWPDGSDGTDVNAVARSRGGDVVATCDDDGLVKLFNCPCVLDDAPHRAYRGHSSHVLGVRFNSDDTMLVSVGGYDWAMFQFNVVELVPVDHGPYLPQKAGRSVGHTHHTTCSPGLPAVAEEVLHCRHCRLRREGCRQPTRWHPRYKWALGRVPEPAPGLRQKSTSRWRRKLTRGTTAAFKKRQWSGGARCLSGVLVGN
ncbi:hypothetical protein Vretifemale_1483 [Volvox reticuliferus]|uniref:EML-like second beta-propeller domain-containing protein n=1 Tax=Volvox reticuliferus TaxID=1737510 RepID=A0A8J4FE18_9CHLO|nr:hypothetical protein Vretifemale_1483 [Volvox reticuliferus]